MEYMIEPNTNRNATVHANASEIFPDAIGLFFFTGCSRSLGASMMSFMKYAAEDIALKAIKAFVVSKNTFPSKRLPKNSGAAKTLKFFNHCLGLAVLITTK